MTSAIGMPDPIELLHDGIRRELGGALGAARTAYEAVAEGRAGDATPALRAEALRRLSDVHRTQCRWDDALLAARESARVAEEAALDACLAEALNAEAGVHLSLGDFSAAVPLLDRMLVLADDDRLRGIALQNLGAVAAQTGDLELAGRRFAESQEAFARAGYRRGEALALNNRGRAALDAGDVAEAARLLPQAVELARRVEDVDLVALATLNHAETLAVLDEVERAEELISSALGFFSSTGNTWRRIECFRLLGDVRRQRGDTSTAVACWKQGLDLARTIHALPDERALEQRLAQHDGGPSARPATRA
jgi:tetratricopeptide (TPR) repeat protein